MDPIFEEEQQHLTNTYEKLLHIEQDVRAQLDADLAEALEDKEDMFDEMTRDFAADIQLETLAELEAMNRIIESYNLSADINTEKLRRSKDKAALGAQRSHCRFSSWPSSPPSSVFRSLFFSLLSSI